jgi:hypothetical protein
MNYLTHVATMTTLALLSTTASADLICDKCEYIYFGTYMGSYWPGDRATFANNTIATELGQFKQFDNYWFFDLNNNAVGVLTVATKAATALDRLFALEIYADPGFVCGILSCPVLTLGEPLISSEASKRWSGKTSLVPGHYVIRIASGTQPSGESAYSGQLSFRAAH